MRATAGSRHLGGLATAAAVAALLLGCTSEDTVGELTAADAVECRELGGGWVYVAYERGSTWEVGVRPRLPGGPGDGDIESIGDDELAARTRARTANGWDDAAVQGLLEREMAPEVAHRLRGMPSCLEELRGEGD